MESGLENQVKKLIQEEQQKRKRWKPESQVLENKGQNSEGPISK